MGASALALSIAEEERRDTIVVAALLVGRLASDLTGTPVFVSLGKIGMVSSVVAVALALISRASATLCLRIRDSE